MACQITTDDTVRIKHGRYAGRLGTVLKIVAGFVTVATRGATFDISIHSVELA